MKRLLTAVRVSVRILNSFFYVIAYLCHVFKATEENDEGDGRFNIAIISELV